MNPSYDFTGRRLLKAALLKGGVSQRSRSAGIPQDPRTPRIPAPSFPASSSRMTTVTGWST
jgi:hypothetical protein